MYVALRELRELRELGAISFSRALPGTAREIILNVDNWVWVAVAQTSFVSGSEVAA